MSLAELRRRAEAGDQKAWCVHQARLFDPKTTLLLWFCLALALSLVIIHIADALEFWQSLAASVVVLVGVQMLTSGAGWPPTGLSLAAQVGPAIAWLFQRFGVTEITTNSGAARLLETGASPIHSKADHLEKLQKQLAEHQDQASQAELKLAIRALTFADQTVKDVMTTRRTMPTIRETVKMTPVVLDELRQSAQDYLPVTDGLRRRFVGILYLVDLIDRPLADQTVVGQRMRREVYYVKGQASLMAVLRAFLKTKQYLFLVVNQAGKVIGSISIEEAIRQVITLTGDPVRSRLELVQAAALEPPETDKPKSKPKPKPKPKPTTKAK